MCMNFLRPTAPDAHGQRGFSLIELLVSLALSMVVVTATTYVYLGTRETQRALGEKNYAAETARYALDTIGRDIENAGFYPSNAISPGASSQVRGYANPGTTAVGVTPAKTGPVAFDAFIFGCEAGRFKPGTTASDNVCIAHTDGADADALVLNYYTNDATGLDSGNRADCLRQDPANDTTFNGTAMQFAVGGPSKTRRNDAHATTTTASRPFLLPNSPLFVSSRYTLTKGTSSLQQVEGAAITTFSLSCHGNGSSNVSYFPLIPGLEQLRFYFLERSAVLDAQSQFQRADGVANWADVVAVRVCLVARSLQAARLQGAASYAVTDCDGTSHSFTDGLERRVLSQTFALKNHFQISNPWRP